MEVTIKERPHQYVSDYPHGWNRFSNDYFKCPVEIGNYKCFVKRFEKKNPSKISGWNLLLDLKGKHEANLPRVNDIVSIQEDSKYVHYLFYDYLEGETLDKVISKDFKEDLQTLCNDLFSALHSLYNRDYWFADFCEKNIFCEKKGRFLLVDLDSAQPLEELPTNDMAGNKEYWSLVFDFYHNILGQKNFRSSDINGISLNYLQVIFLLLRLRMFYSNKIDEYDTAKLFHQLPATLNNISPSFSKIFDRIFQNEIKPLSENDISEIKKLVDENIINYSGSYEDKGIDESIEVPEKHLKSKVSSRPVIIRFGVTNHIAQDGNNYTVESGKTFVLSWDVENVSNIELHKNGVLYKTLNTEEESIEIIEVAYDGKEKKIEYTLMVSNDVESIKSRGITVIVKESVEREPVIKRFEVVDYIDKNEDGYVIESGKPFSLVWETANAKNTEIQKNEQPLKTFTNNESSIELTETVYDRPEKKINYTLIISSGTEQKKSKSLNIIVKKFAAARPVINQFKANKYVLRSGGSFTLKWSVKNASDIKLYRNNELYKSFTTTDATISLRENYKGKEEKIKYELSISNGEEIIKSNPLFISIKPPLNWKVMAIIAVLLVLFVGFIYKSYFANRNGTTTIPSVDPNGPTDTSVIKKNDGSSTELAGYNFYQTEITGGTIITIHGKNIPADDSSLRVTFNNVKGEIISRTKDSINVLVPILSDESENIAIIIHTDTDNKNDTITNVVYKPPSSTPSVYSITQTQIAPTADILISGRNLPRGAGTIKVTFNGVGGNILEQTRHSIYVEVPELSGIDADAGSMVNITVYVNGKVLRTENVLYKKPTIPFVNPLNIQEVTAGEVITITGGNLPQNAEALWVQFNFVKGRSVAQTSSSLSVRVPDLISTTKEVEIGVYLNNRVVQAARNVPYHSKNKKSK
jgi:hypothetical protein